MGQRLVIGLKSNNNQIISTCYWHWAGYTGNSLKLGAEVIKNIYNVSNRNPLDITLLAFDLPRENTGFLDEESLYVEQHYNVKENEIPKCKHRDFGVIGMNTKTMERYLRMTNTFIIINIDTQTVMFNGFYVDADGQSAPNVIECVKLDVDPDEEMSFDDFLHLADTYVVGKNYCYNGIFYVPCE